MSQREIGYVDDFSLFHLFHLIEIQCQRGFEVEQVACSRFIPGLFQATPSSWLAWNEVGQVDQAWNKGLVPAQSYTTIGLQRFFDGWNEWNKLFRAQERFPEERSDVCTT
jgi:hypothetical protein